MLTGVQQRVIDADATGHDPVEVKLLYIFVTGKWIESQRPVTLIDVINHLLLVLVGNHRHDRTKYFPLDQNHVFSCI